MQYKSNNSSYKTTRDILPIEINFDTLVPNREHRHKCLDVERSRNTANRHRIFGSYRVFHCRTHACREATMLVFTCETELLCICSNCVVFVALKRTTRHRLANREFVNQSHAVEPQIRQVPFQTSNFVYLRLFFRQKSFVTRKCVCVCNLHTEIFALFVIGVD